MPVSEAKLAANRRNAALSTGPRTPEGKERSRRNGLTHGLTGSGVALPTEDQAEISRRFAALRAQMRPKSDAGEQLVRRYAFLSVRLERSERHETSQTAGRIRHAIAKFDDERLAAVEALADRLYHEPATTVRRLQVTPEGIDWLRTEWSTLRADLNHEEKNRWTTNHRSRFDTLLGLNPGGYRVARIMALSEAVFGSFHHLDKADGDGLEGPARAEWARAELTRLIDEEVSRLDEVRARIDHEAIAADRAEAVDRALFDAAPEATLARKYEAATERAMYKALKEFRQVEAEFAEGPDPEVGDCEVEESDPVGSDCRGDEADPTPAKVEAESGHPEPDGDPSESSFPNISIGRAPKIEPGAAGPIDRG